MKVGQPVLGARCPGIGRMLQVLQQRTFDNVAAAADAGSDADEAPAASLGVQHARKAPRPRHATAAQGLLPAALLPKLDVRLLIEGMPPPEVAAWLWTGPLHSLIVAVLACGCAAAR